MATCKDCIHYDICATKDEKVSLSTRVKELVADDFTCFKNKADFVEVVHGEWIMDDFTHQPHCSVCGRVQPYDTVNGYLDYWDCDYCTICGAKMDGERKKNDKE